MKYTRWFLLSVLLAFAAALAAPQLLAQSQTTGDVTGAVTDQSGASVPEAKIALKDLSKGSTQETQTNKDGVYHFYLLTPGAYSVTVTAANFQATSRPLTVNLGQIASLNFTLNVASSNTTVVVTEESPLLQTADGNHGWRADHFANAQRGERFDGHRAIGAGQRDEYERRRRAWKFFELRRVGFFESVHPGRYERQRSFPELE
jgi:hypothetical protein